jgi:hypothetical protein
MDTGWKEVQWQDDFINNLNIYIYMLQKIYTGLCKCV